jgi:outer membrane protein
MRSPGTVCLLALAVMIPATAPAQTLEECLELARRQAPTLLASSADVSRAEQAIREAEAALAPSVRLDAAYTRNSEAPKAVFDIPGNPQTQVIALGSADQVDLRAVAQLTLYSGGRNRDLVRAAVAARDGRTRNRAQTEADLVFRVSQAFYRAITAERLEAAAHEAENSARSHSNTTTARVRAGVAPRVDSLRAAADLLQRYSAVVRAREAVRLSRIELANAIGAPLDTTRALVPPGFPESGLPEPKTEIERAVGSRPELLAFDSALREVASRQSAAEAARLPLVALSATGEYTAPNTRNDYLDFNDPGLKTYKLYAGISASMPLFDGGLTRARVAQLELQQRALQEQRADAVLGIRAEVEKALSNLRVALSVWPSDSSRVGASREALRLAEVGYREGTSTATDVRDAEAALADARAAEAQTCMDYWIARAALDRADGSTAGKEHSQ